MMLKFIEEHAVRMHQLAAGLQQYIFASESGRETWTAVDCNQVVKMAVSTLQETIEETGTVVDYQTLPTVQSIELLLVQLFKNLISNSIKYRSSDPPRIQISVKLTGGEWVFSVRDNGIGIDSKYFEYIFGVFKRLHGGDRSG